MAGNTRIQVARGKYGQSPNAVRAPRPTPPKAPKSHSGRTDHCSRAIGESPRPKTTFIGLAAKERLQLAGVGYAKPPRTIRSHSPSPPPFGAMKHWGKNGRPRLRAVQCNTKRPKPQSSLWQSLPLLLPLESGDISLVFGNTFGADPAWPATTWSNPPMTTVPRPVNRHERRDQATLRRVPS